MFESILFGIVFAATFGGIAAFRYFGADHRMFDIPNERSSHVAPTLRGAGVVMVAVCLVTYLLVGRLFEVEIKWVYICSVLLVAAISWLDDVRGVAPVIRRPEEKLNRVAELIDEIRQAVSIRVPHFFGTKAGRVAATLRDNHV